MNKKINKAKQLQVIEFYFINKNFNCIVYLTISLFIITLYRTVRIMVTFILKTNDLSALPELPL